MPDMTSAEELRKVLPNAEIGMLFGNVKFTDEMIKSFSENKFDVDVYYKCVNAEMVEKLHKNGIKVIMDIVPNHTSDKHKWFIESKKSKNNAENTACKKQVEATDPIDIQRQGHGQSQPEIDTHMSQFSYQRMNLHNQNLQQLIGISLHKQLIVCQNQKLTGPQT